MMTLTTRSYGGKTDLEAIASLLNTSKSAVTFDEWPSVQEMLMQFDDPSFDKNRDFCLWETEAGKLVAVAGLMIPAAESFNRIIWFGVLPSAKSEDLETEILHWGAGRMREFAKERDIDSIAMLCPVHEDNSDRINLLEDNGFQIERYFLAMERSLSEPIPEPQLPQGFRLRSPAGEEDAETWVQTFNETFADHWNHWDITVEAFLHKLDDPSYRSDLSLVAIAPDGTMAALCDCSILENDGPSSKQGWITVLGTRRAFRQRGLGRGILQAALRNFKAEGLDSVILYVDAENLSGATRLYESVGFRRINTQIAYMKELSTINN
ncbi:MAG: GNAT family N-acetyltransferase [Cyanobacteriota bacterium]|nr:GNAT family N-acetyltransferase [Cyanobacteriota bacterium]